MSARASARASVLLEKAADLQPQQDDEAVVDPLPGTHAHTINRKSLSNRLKLIGQDNTARKRAQQAAQLDGRIGFAREASLRFSTPRRKKEFSLGWHCEQANET